MLFRLLCFIVLYGYVPIAAQSFSIEWDKTFGTDYNDRPRRIIKIPKQNRFIICGISEGGKSLDKTSSNRSNSPYADIWLICIDDNGNKLWDKILGTTSYDVFGDICLSNDSASFVMVCSPFNDFPDGDFTAPVKGGADFNVIKIDFNGNKIWDRRYGGTLFESGLSIISAPDNGYVVAGCTVSGATGDISTPNFNPGINDQSPSFTDVWVIRLNSEGNLIWENRLGGGGTDELVFNDGYIYIYIPEMTVLFGYHFSPIPK